MAGDVLAEPFAVGKGDGTFFPPSFDGSIELPAGRYELRVQREDDGQADLVLQVLGGE